MKPITDTQAATALRHIKPILGYSRWLMFLIGLAAMIYSMILDNRLDRYLQTPWPSDNPAPAVQHIAESTWAIHYWFCIGIVLIVLAILPHSKDILLRYLGEKHLAANAAPPDKTADTANNSHASRQAARKHDET